MSNNKKAASKKEVKNNSNKKINSNSSKDKIISILNKIKVIILKFFRQHWDLILMNIIIFILTIIIESQYL